MLLQFETSLYHFFLNNWASILSWLLVITCLIVIRKYQIKWRKERQLAVEQRRAQALVVTTISKDSLKSLREQVDLLHELAESTNNKLSQNNSNIDKEVLELAYKIAANKAQGRVSNVE